MSNTGNGDETEYVYSNEEENFYNQQNETPKPSPVQPSQPERLTLQQVLDLIKTLDYGRVRIYVDELQADQFRSFKQQPYVFVVVKEMIDRLTQRYGNTEEINLSEDDTFVSGLEILRLFKKLGMDVYQGNTQKSKDRPANLAARANPSIGIPILQTLMEGHKSPESLGSPSVLQPDGYYEMKLVKEQEVMEIPKGEKPPIFDAIEMNRYKTVEYLIKQGSKLNEIKHPLNGDSPLSIAILQAINKDIAVLLKNNKANVNFEDKYGEPLLQSIIRNQFVWDEAMPKADAKTKGEIRLFFVDLIAKSPYYAPKKDGQGRIPVLVATMQGCTRILDILLKLDSIRTQMKGIIFGSFLYALQNSSYISPDVLANANGKRGKMDGIVKYFLQRMDYNLPAMYEIREDTATRSGIPLLESAIAKDTELLRLLKDRNFLGSGYGNHLQQRLTGQTNPVTYAIQKKRLESLRILAEHKDFKAMLSISDDGQRLPLIEAMKENDLDILNFLLENGADPNKESGLGETPLLTAILSMPTFVKFFLDKGADPNKQGRDGKTPLIVTIERAPELVNLLLEKGADPNLADKNGNFPLLMAMEKGDQALINLLISKGAKSDALLIKASMSGSIDVIKSLLKDGNVDPTAQTLINGKRYTAYDLAQTTEIRLLLAPYFEKDKPRFKGFSKKDFDLFRGDFWNNIDFQKPELEWKDFTEVSVCPICFFVNFIEPGYCNYVSHDCTATGNFVHQDLLKTYETVTRGGSKAAWCTSCSRICRDRQGHYGLEHCHFSIEPPIPNFPKKEIPKDNDPFRRECYVSGGGGYIVEKFFRMQELLNLMCKLNNEYIDKISIDTAFKLTREHFIGCTVPVKSFFDGGRQCKDVIDAHLLLKKVEQVREHLQTLNDINIGIGDDMESYISDFIDDNSLETLLAIEAYLQKHFQSVMTYLSDNTTRPMVEAKVARMTSLLSVLAPLKQNKSQNVREILSSFFQSLQESSDFITVTIEEITLNPKKLHDEEAVDSIIRTGFKLAPDTVKKIIDDADKVRIDKKFEFPDTCDIAEEVVLENIVYDNVTPLVKLIKKPKVIVNPPTDYNDTVGKVPCFIHGEEPAGSKLYKFTHLQPSKNSEGNPKYHTHEDYICKWAVVDYIRSYLDSQDPLECYNPSACEGNFHPMEIKFLFYTPIEVDERFKSYEQDEEENKANKIIQMQEQKLKQEYEAEVLKEDQAYDEVYKVWLAGWGDNPDSPDALAEKPVDPKVLRQKYKDDLLKYDMAFRRKAAGLKNVVVPPKPEWPAGLFQKRILDPTPFRAKEIEWTEEEIKERKEKREAELQELWQKYANKWMRTAKDFIAKFGSDYNGENKNLLVENAPGAVNNGAQGGGAYVFHSVGSLPGSCKSKRVKGGYRKTRRLKKVLKTRKTKRYNRTRKH